MVGCPHCHRSFTRPSSLKRHVVVAHTGHHGHHAARRPYQCDQCAKHFVRQDNMQRHKRLHDGSGLRPCPHCSRSFRKDYMTKHSSFCLVRATCRPAVTRRVSTGQVPAKTAAFPSFEWTTPGNASFALPPGSSEQVRNANPHRVRQPVRFIPQDPQPRLLVPKDLLLQACTAICDGDLGRVTALLDSLRGLDIAVPRFDRAFKAFWGGSGMLKVAVWAAHVPIIRHLLLDRGLDANETHGRSGTVLFPACLTGDVDVLTALIRGGADLERVSPMGSALDIAVAFAHDDAVRLLVANGARLDGDRGRTLLRIVSQPQLHPMMWVAKLLVRAGSGLEVRDDLGCTALHYAAEMREPELLRLMLEKRPRVDVGDGQGRTPLDRATAVGDSVAIKQLLDSQGSECT